MALLLTTIVLCALAVTTRGNPLNCTNHEINDIIHMICKPKSSILTEISIKRWKPKKNGKISNATLKRCNIRGFDEDALWELRNIQYLDLSENFIDELPMSLLNHASKLKHLDLSHNKLKNILYFSHIFDDIPLQYLDLSCNQLKQTDLDKLPTLRVLKYNDNAFDGFELDNNNEVIIGVNKIEMLDLSRNRLQGAPDYLLEHLERLEELYLSQCSLQSVPSFILLFSLKTVIKLDLSHNHITEINQESFKQGDYNMLEALRYINFSYNAMKRILENSFRNLNDLGTVDLSHNLLTMIPAGLFNNMNSLSEVYLSGNRLAYIKDNVFGKNALTMIDLSDNYISFLPQNFAEWLDNAASEDSNVDLLLNDNPIDCVCQFDFRKECLDYNRVKVQGNQNGTCYLQNSPSVLKCSREPMEHKFILEHYLADRKTHTTQN